jgi:dihydroorotate dehydrogenase (fumarate)
MARIAGVEFGSGIMNAACSVAKTPEDVKALSKTGIDAIVVGSITPEARLGNAEPRWYADSGYALNSFGMPNDGAEYYTDVLPDMINTAHAVDKRLILSIAGFSLADYVRLAGVAETAQVDMLEINLGCPNVRTDGGIPEPIASFNPDYMSQIVEAVAKETKLPISLKLSPYSNPAELESVAKLVNTFDTVDAVVASNSFPNGTYFDTEGKPVLAVGFGGVTGEVMRPIALGQVSQFRKHLDSRIEVIGAGGIERREHVELFRHAGAVAFQAATLIVRDGHSAIDRLI